MPVTGPGVRQPRTPLDDPTLDLVGDRTIRSADVVVTLNVRGTLSQPFVTISSEPPLPEAEALSYLLTGRSINTLQSGEAASLDRADTPIRRNPPALTRLPLGSSWNDPSRVKCGLPLESVTTKNPPP